MDISSVIYNIQKLGANYKNIGNWYPVLRDDAFLTSLGGFMNVSNCLAKFFWGHLNDKFSIKILLTC